MVEFPEKFKDLVAHGGASPDLLAAFSFEMIHYVTEMMNARINITYQSSYGQVSGKTVPTQGLFGMTVRKEVEICGSPVAMFLDPVRLKYFEYTNVFVPVEGVIVFRAPPLSYETNVFSLPFPVTLWAAAAAVMLLCAGLLTLVTHSERSLAAAKAGTAGKAGPDFGDDHAEDHALHSGADALLMTVAAVCQQGYSTDLRSVPGRIIVLMMLMLLLLLYTCYSASIVVLMQSTSTKITHYKDLLDTQMKFGLVNTPYIVFYVSKETEPVRRKLYTDKVLENGRAKHLYNVTEAVRKVQHEYFALNGFKNLIYGAISRTWTEDEKCGLVTLGRDFVSVKDPQIALAKHTHNAEAIRIMLRRIVERGIRNRFDRKFTHARPTCSNNAARFNSVSLTDVRAPFQILLSLMAASVAVLLAELAWHRRQDAVRQRRAGERRPAFVEAMAPVAVPARD
ncbi:uncharacterized protein LOC117651203 [Thrips palmi]|uniref:Uncharacterized protein LOC117651203 n=1 Tax=Thrips palmi TaxID=161013 RepID=A0A6P9A281_THRPL|nr:uncharacterized protein LOC117651203 [Thrips palmi]